MQGIARAGARCAALWLGFGWLDAAPADDLISGGVAPAPFSATASQAGPNSTARPVAASPAAANSAPRIGWQTLARSMEERIIEYAQFGQGEQQALVIAPLAGDEAEGSELLERLANHLAQFPRSLNNTTVTIVRDPNPDGRFRRTAGNARGVLLDQNFPTRHWRRTPSADRWLSGREPESEPETRALIDLLTDLKPQRILVLGSGRRPPTLHYAGPAEALAGQFANLARVRPLPLNSAEAAGALAAYAGYDRELPTLVFRVTAKVSAEQNWLQYKRALLAFLGEQAELSDAQRDPSAPSADEPTTEAQEPRKLGAPVMPIALQSKDGEKSTADESTSQDQPELAPRVLSAAELEADAPLAPVGRPPEARPRVQGPVMPPSTPANAPAPQSSALQRPEHNVYPSGVGRPGASAVAPPRRSAPSRPQGGWVAKSPAAPAQGSAPFVPPVYQGATVGQKAEAEAGQAAKPAAQPAATTAVPVTPAAPQRLQRLPPVDPSAPPLRDLRQDPIPFYPATGY